MTIAVDFDGTIVDHKYPDIGKEKPFAIDTLKQLAAEGNKLILWTSRDGDLLTCGPELAFLRARAVLQLGQRSRRHRGVPLDGSSTLVVGGGKEEACPPSSA